MFGACDPDPFRIVIYRKLACQADRPRTGGRVVTASAIAAAVRGVGGGGNIRDKMTRF